MKLKTRLFLSIVAVLMLLCSDKSANAGEPTEAIRGAVNQGVEILKNAKLDNQKQRAQVIDQLRQIVYPLFDFNEMAMRSLGANWRRLTPQQRKEFVATFTALLEKTYANQIDLYFSKSGPASSAKELSRAVAIGDVSVRQEDRRGTSNRAEYTASDGKFVLSGGKPTLYDSTGDTTTGRQLTFFFADDRIVVDSEEGSRTLSLHRVEK